MIAQYAREQNVIVVTDSRQLLKDESGSLVTNLGETGASIATLPTDAEVGCHFIFRVGAAFSFTVAHGQATNKFISGGVIQAADKDLVADDEAEELRVTKVSSTEWLCAAIGTWTIET